MKHQEPSNAINTTVNNDRINNLCKDFLQPMFAAMPIGIAYCKMIYKDDSPQDCEFIFVNTAFESLTGLKNASKKVISELIPGIHSSDPELLEMLGKVASNEKIEKGEIYINALNLWFSISAHSPEKGYFIATIDLINERKQNEKALHFKTELLEAQLNASIEGILIVDRQGKKILQNQRTIDLWKIPQHIVDDPDDQTQVQHVQQVTKDPQHFVNKIIHLYHNPDETSRDEVELIDGTVLDRYSAPVIGKDGHNYGRIWAFRDITKRKRNEEALRQKTALLEALLNSTLEGIMVMDEHGQKLIENQRTIDLWKIPPELVGNCNIPGRQEHIRKMAKNPELFKQNISHLIGNSDRTNRDELELVDGTVLDRYSAPVVGVDGHYYGRIWTFRDVTRTQAGRRSFTSKNRAS